MKNKSLIQGWDAAVAFPPFWPKGRLYDFPDPRKGPGRQYRGRRFRCVGICDVLHAERIVSGLSSHDGERPRPLQLASAELPPTIISATCWTRRIRAPAALFRTHGGVAERAANAGSFRPAGRKDPDRRGRNGVLLLAETQLPALPTRKRANGKTESCYSTLSPTVVAPGHSEVVPLTPEFIAPQDGAEKQDCERNAVKRWFEKHSGRLAPLRPVIPGDDLFACHLVAKMITMPATISSSPASRLHTRRRTTSSTGPSSAVTRLRDPLIFERARFRRFSAIRPDAERTNRLTRALISRQRPSKIRKSYRTHPVWRAFSALGLTPGCKSPAAKNEGMAEVTRSKSAVAIQKRRFAIAGSGPFRCATARMRSWSTGSVSRF